MSGPTLSKYLSAQQSLAHAVFDTTALVKGTDLESDTRFAAFLAAADALADLIWEVHKAAEETEGMCPDCRAAADAVLPPRLEKNT
jgi:hypothetical protein